KTSSRIRRAFDGRGVVSIFANQTADAVTTGDSQMIERQNSTVPDAGSTTPKGPGDPDLAVARRVIRAEICGLERLGENLDGAFESAVNACAAVRGRIIVTGIGKSGHIGRKIAATLASTGTPAQFVHPVEASHGDLGMIGSEDAI